MPFKSHKVLPIYSVKSDGSPSDSDLALINKFTKREFKSDELYMRTAILAHNAIDRDGEVFDEALLQRFAETLPGKGLFNKHPRGYDGDSGPGLGRWFKASVIDVSIEEARTLLKTDLVFPSGVERAKLLEASYYLPRSDKNRDLILDIDAGVASDVSIGFSASSRSDVVDPSGAIIAKRIHGPGEALEGSMVWLGAQPGAQTIKSAGTRDELTIDEDTIMPMTDTERKEFNDAKSQAEAEKKRADNLQAQVDEQAADVTLAKSVKEKLGNDVAVDTVVQAITDAKSVRDELVEAIISGKRLKKAMGDSEDEKNQAESFYKNMPLPMLRKEHELWTQNLPGETSQIHGGETGAGAGGEGGKAGLRDASVTQKALGNKDAA